MSAAPKLLRILDALAARLAAIDGTDPYYTAIGKNVRRGANNLNMTETPAVVLKLEPRVSEEDQPRRQRIAAAVTIHGRMEYYGTMDPETVGIQMMADIARAIETGDRTLGGLIATDMNWRRDEIFYPDATLPIIAAEVQYSIPHHKHWGDPTK